MIWQLLTRSCYFSWWLYKSVVCGNLRQRALSCSCGANGSSFFSSSTFFSQIPPGPTFGPGGRLTFVASGVGLEFESKSPCSLAGEAVSPKPRHRWAEVGLSGELCRWDSPRTLPEIKMKAWFLHDADGNKTNSWFDFFDLDFRKPCRTFYFHFRSIFY